MEKQVGLPQENVRYSSDDEIDLFELWDSLVEEKLTIILSIVIALVVAAVYILSAKPTYEVKTVFQLPQIQIQGFNFQKQGKDRDNGSLVPYVPLETAETTIALLSDVLPVSLSENKKTSGVIFLSAIGGDRNEIREKIIFSVNQLKQRYQMIFDKLAANAKVVEILPGEVIGNIKVSEQPIKPKKTLILAVSGVLGLMLGIFIALIRRAIKNRKASLTVS